MRRMVPLLLIAVFLSVLLATGNQTKGEPESSFSTQIETSP